MKKILSVILILTINISLVSCRNNNNSGETESKILESNTEFITDELKLMTDRFDWSETIARTISNIKYSIPQNFTNSNYYDDGVTYEYKNGEIAIFICKQPLEDAEIYSIISDEGPVIFAVKSNNSKSDIEKLKATISIEKNKTSKPKSTTTKPKTTTTTTKITTSKRTTTPTKIVTTTTTKEVQLGTSNALSKARDYLNVMAFSYLGLIKQLEYEQFTHEEAVYGADNCGANWYDQATKKAQDYLDTMAFSHSGLIKQLEYEQFTNDEAVYGANNCGADWNEQAAKKAQDYLDVMSFSRQELINQLVYEGFSQGEAEYGVSAVGY